MSTNLAFILTLVRRMTVAEAFVVSASVTVERAYAVVGAPVAAPLILGGKG